MAADVAVRADGVSQLLRVDDSAETDHDETSLKRRERSRESEEFLLPPTKKPISTIDYSYRDHEDQNSDQIYIVYIKGQHHKLTSKNPNNVAKSIEEQFRKMKCITQRGESMKLTCFHELQKSHILSATYLNGVDIAIVPSKPRMEERRRQEDIHPRQKRVVIMG